MRIIYTLGIRAYAGLLRLAALFIPKAAAWVNGRKNFFENLPNVQDKEVYWFHCASLGEFDQGLPIMNLLRENKPDAFIVATFFSPSGMEHYHKRKHPLDYACYLPIDTSKNANRFIQHFHPKVAIFVKYEFWSNYIFTAKSNGTKILSVSTNLRSNQRFFKWYGGYFRKTLKQFDYFFAQNKETEQLLQSIGIRNIQVTGDTRFDRVIENREQLTPNLRIERFLGDAKKVFIAGSTWPIDEKVISPLLKTDLFDKYIIAPHNVDKSHVQGLIDRLNVPVQLYTNIDEIASYSTKVLIIDTIGQLASAYSYGHIAYVGGGFSGSLHNILEPAVFGLPVIYGPKFSRFPEGEFFIEEGIGFSIEESDQFIAKIVEIQKSLPSLSQKSSDFVEKNRGASQKIIAHLLS